MKLTLASEQDQGGDGLGIVPPNFLRNAAEELEGGDHAGQDCLGALEGERQNKGGVGVGPGGDQERDEPPSVGKVDMDMAEIRLETVAWEMPQRDEGFSMAASVFE